MMTNRIAFKPGRLYPLLVSISASVLCVSGQVVASPSSIDNPSSNNQSSHNQLSSQNQLLNPGTQTSLVFLTAAEMQPVDTSGAASEPGTDRYDFGTSVATSGTPIQHVFLLRNNTGRELMLDHVQPTCGCTTAYAGDAPGDPQPKIAAGGWVPIHVSVDPSSLTASHLWKSVNVFVVGQAVPAATLLVTGKLVDKAANLHLPAPIIAPTVPNVALPNSVTAPALTMAPSASSSPQTVSANLQNSFHLTVLGETALGEAPSAIPPIGAAHYDFGHVNALAGDHIEHIFTLYNDNDTPLHLDHLQTSCGCTSAVVDTGISVGRSASPSTSALPFSAVGLPTSSVVVAPHSQIRIHESIDPSHLSAGAVEKYLWVYVQGQSDPAAILQTTGTLDSGAVFAPSILDFGRVVAGSAPIRRLVLTLDHRLLPPGTTLRLAGSDSELVISPATLEGEPHDGKVGTEAASKADSYAHDTHTYQVGISPSAHLGLIDGALSLLLVSASGAVQATNVSVPLRGQVLGGISASPQVIAFGMVTSGATAVQEVLVTGASVNALRKLKATTNSSYLMARLVQNPAKRERKGLASAVLRVSLSPRMPAGSLETQVNIAMPDGQQLVIPTSVYVVQPQSHP